MSHFECRLNRRFWRSKKVAQVVQIWGEGGGGIQKKSSFFFLKSSLRATDSNTVLTVLNSSFAYELAKNVLSKHGAVRRFGTNVAVVSKKNARIANAVQVTF